MAAARSTKCRLDTSHSLYAECVRYRVSTIRFRCAIQTYSHWTIADPFAAMITHAYTNAMVIHYGSDHY